MQMKKREEFFKEVWKYECMEGVHHWDENNALENLIQEHNQEMHKEEHDSLTEEGILKIIYNLKTIIP